MAQPLFDVFLYFFIKICYNIKKDKKILHTLRFFRTIIYEGKITTKEVEYGKEK